MPVLRPALRPALCAASLVLVLLTGLADAEPAAAQTAVAPVAPQPAEGAVQPGLAVRYYFHMFRHINELIDWQDYKEGKPGPVIKRLNYQVGQDDVLTSGVDDGVGAELTQVLDEVVGERVVVVDDEHLRSHAPTVPAWSAPAHPGSALPVERSAAGRVAPWPDRRSGGCPAGA